MEEPFSPIDIPLSSLFRRVLFDNGFDGGVADTNNGEHNNDDVGNFFQKRLDKTYNNINESSGSSYSKEFSFQLDNVQDAFRHIFGLVNTFSKMTAPPQSFEDSQNNNYTENDANVPPGPKDFFRKNR
jgi:hypothetical protein